MTAEPCDVLVLGGGAAGLFCAFTAGRRGRRVRVIEHANRVGKKILMSGGGRCNFTNRRVGAEHFLSANPDFCKSALARYAPQDFIALVEKHGISYHEKELGQLFCDDSSKQIVKLLLDECAAARVDVRVDCEVKTVTHGADGFTVHTASGASAGDYIGIASATAQGVMRAPKLVVATGGLSVPTLGASGFGYELARQFGHAVLPTRAGLVPLTLSGRPLEQWQDLSGVSLPVEASADGATFTNAMLITHRGLSGPALLQISNYWQPGEPLQINLFPQADALEFLLEKQKSQPAAELRTVLAEALPKRFAQRFCELLAPRRAQVPGTILELPRPPPRPPSKPMRQYPREELRSIAAALNAWPVTPSGTEGYRTAEVTLGGVDTREISSGSFESRRVPGLYFIGEVLDVSGWLGGYNFQWAWASAHACGHAL